MDPGTRTWTTVGGGYVEQLGREAVEAEIAAMDWQEVPEGGKLTLAFMPGVAINEVIKEFGLRHVSRVAVSSFERPADNPDEDGFYPGFYGIEAHYANGRARLYVLDTGTEVCPLLSDFWPDGDRVDGAARRST